MAAAAYAARKNRERMQKMAEDREETRRYVADVMKTWDKSKTGDLQTDEVKAWLSTVNDGKPVTDNEAQWVVYMCSSDMKEPTENLQTVKKNTYLEIVNNSVRPGDLAKALEHFMAYKKARGIIEDTFHKFDTNKSNSLDTRQLGDLLKELNEGEVVPEEEVNWVMHHADVLGNNSITKPELVIAISLWYTRQDMLAQAAGGVGSMCGRCHIM